MVDTPPRYLKDEWHVRKRVMDAILGVLSDGQSYSSRQLLDLLATQGLTVPKKLINSILFSEAHRYILYDHKAFTYQLRECPQDQFDQAAEFSLVNNDADKVSQEIRARYIGRNDEYVFVTSKLTGSAFFETSAKSRTIQVILNENHPIFPSLKVLLESNSNDDLQEMNQRLMGSRKLFELLLASWCKYENDQPNGPRKFKVEESRLDWGRSARLFLLDELEDDE